MMNTQTSIFLHESKNQQQIFQYDSMIQSSIPYLKKGDSNLYIDQFLVKDKQQQEQMYNRLREMVNKQNQLFYIQSQSQHSDSHIRLQRNDNLSQDELTQSQQHNASVFHNFQKHLTIALRMIVTLNHVQSDRNSIIVAKKLWKIFKQSTVTAKKMLHYILGEKNQHSINYKLLEKYGFKEIYDYYPEPLINQAKAFLRIQALNQLKQANLVKYTSKRRIKNQQYFILYIKQFMTELQEGFLKKRIKKEKVLKD